MTQDDRTFGADFVQRTLDGFGRQYVALFALSSAQLQVGKPDILALQAPMLEQYRRLFVPPGFPTPADRAVEGAAAVSRWQQAVDRSARIAAEVALDASQRFAVALQQGGPESPPITTLRELHELWVECGESAYAAAAHREEFAAALAELLAAMTELQAADSPR